MGVRIAMVAGEPSGDLLASLLIPALREALPDAHFYGIGGPRMAAQGFDVVTPMDALSVFGYVDALKNYRRISSIRKEFKKTLLADPPDVFIGVDAPDFNLGLEADLKAKSIRTVHYVSPSVWAWRAGRIKKIVRSADHLLCLFPFEPKLYEGQGIGVTYIGHPVADTIPLRIDRAEIRETLQIPSRLKVIALLPGSRQSEIQRLAEPMLKAAALIRDQEEDVLFLVPLATRETRMQFEGEMFRLGLADVPIRLMFGHAQDAMGAADVALVASGTATLEAALMKCPHVVTYKVGGFQAWLLKRLAYLPYVSLPNVLAGRFLVPELLQDAATPEALAEALLRLLSDLEQRRAMVAEFSAIHESLRQDSPHRAARAILGVMGRGAALREADENQPALV
jgi:lipid-A-disaccharide synthase